MTDQLKNGSAFIEAPLTPNVSGDFVSLDRQECLDLGKSLHDTYVNNEPYPHIVIENFLPADLLRRVVSEFPQREQGRFSDANSKLKTGYQMEKIQSHLINNLQTALNSSQFLGFLENMTGIHGLIPDPHFAGGGLHETARGGHLSIHADFNMHPKLRLRRRLNLILFLNEGWQDEWGGHLELWEKDMSKCRHAVAPVMGRAVVFNTDGDSFHGHPDPTQSPENVYRRSIALYYYNAVDNIASEQARTTDFRVRPGSADQKPPLKTRIREIARDLVPPLLARRLNLY
ncbi:MAG: 2OG-Fe(II) oxygenase [Pseudomonadota bacterium]